MHFLQLGVANGGPSRTHRHGVVINTNLDCRFPGAAIRGPGKLPLPALRIAKLQMGMSDNDDIRSRLTNRMDDAFCARMRAAIKAGLESAPIGVVTTPGTQNPKYVPTKPHPPVSSQRAMEDA